MTEQMINLTVISTLCQSIKLAYCLQTNCASCELPNSWKDSQVHFYYGTKIDRITICTKQCCSLSTLRGFFFGGGTVLDIAILTYHIIAAIYGSHVLLYE
jgi:hypothetical protein